MTLTSEIINDAFRQSNILALGTPVPALQEEEALRFLNRIVKSVFGNEAGDPFQSFPIGRNHIERPTGYPWWDTVPDNDWFVPKNTRVMLNIDQGDVRLYLHPDPDNGSRFAAIDVSNTLSTFPVTVFGNGRTIDNQFSISLDTDGYNNEWFFRSDTGNWHKYFPLLTTDIFPFPVEFDDFFITLLAMRINPAYGAQLDPQSQAIFQRSRSQLRARYTQNIPARSELALIRMPRTVADRYQWDNTYQFYSPSAAFDKGYSW